MLHHYRDGDTHPGPAWSAYCFDCHNRWDADSV
jgi:hypothetical protein